MTDTFGEKLLVSANNNPPDVLWRKLAPPGFRTPSWLIERGFSYQRMSPSEVITVPEGFEFDGHSVPLSIVPWPLWIVLFVVCEQMDVAPWIWSVMIAGCILSFLPRLIFPRSHPQYMAAAALHDWLYTQHTSPRTRSDADALYYEALRRLGIGRVWAWLMWLAVWAGGWIYWNPRRTGNRWWEVALSWLCMASAPEMVVDKDRQKDR